MSSMESSAALLAINAWGEPVVVVIDAGDLAWASGYVWRTTIQGHVYRNSSVYKGRSGHRVKTTVRVYLHREKMGLRRGHKRVVDHLNNNPLDNRGVNLQVVRKATNVARGDHGLGILPLAVPA